MILEPGEFSRRQRPVNIQVVFTKVVVVLLPWLSGRAHLLLVLLAAAVIVWTTCKNETDMALAHSDQPYIYIIYISEAIRALFSFSLVGFFFTKILCPDWINFFYLYFQSFKL